MFIRLIILVCLVHNSLTSCWRSHSEQYLDPLRDRRHYKGVGFEKRVIATLVLLHTSKIYEGKETFPTTYPLSVYNMYRNRTQEKITKTVGVWSPWSSWMLCSRTCGGGVTQQTRYCVAKPANLRFVRKQRRRRQLNGCVGLYKRIRLCNTQVCPSGADFRSEQCAAFNDRPFKGKTYFWKPFLNAPDECSLNCRAIGFSFYATLNKTVIDGTQCNHPLTSYGKIAPKGTRGVCIEGSCKVGLILGIMGAFRREELMKIKTSEIEDLNTALLVHIPDTKTKTERQFVIRGNFYYTCKKYMELWPPSFSCIPRFFLNYQKGKCTKQPVGITKFGSLASVVAQYLKLPDPAAYTGHCLRRPSATILVDSGADITALKRHGGWRSTVVAEGYIDHSLNNKTDTANKTLNTVEDSAAQKNVENINRDFSVETSNSFNLNQINAAPQPQFQEKKLMSSFRNCQNVSNVTANVYLSE